MKKVFFLLLLFCCIVQLASAQKVDINKVLKVAKVQYASYIKTYPDSTKHPRSSKEDGSIDITSSRNWTSGFFAGNLWYLYQFTKDNKWKINADKWTCTLENEKNTKTTHDLGFILYCSYGNAYNITKDDKYKDVLLQGAKSLSTRFSPVVGAIRSWDLSTYHYPVIVDNLMNLEYLCWTYNITNDTTYRNIVTSHANTDMKYRFRKDSSSFHVLDFDGASGKLLRRVTHQGLNDSSCWARGQAWAIYGYTMLYRETKNIEYLNTAKKAAGYFINKINQTKDFIPNWDFNDNTTNAPKDASAAAVAASGLLELSKYDINKKSIYYKTAEKILASLCTDEYLAAPNSNNFFLLKHSTGNKPANSEIDTPLVYADYYFLEALWRYKNYSTLKN
jgi:hypothetical protein